MKTLVVYDTKHGCTREIARNLAAALGEGAATMELGNGKRAAIEEYEAVVLGGPVYAGSWSRRASAFARENLGALTEKRFAAFASGYDIGRGPALLRAALPRELTSSAVALVGLGGAYSLSRMSGMERFILRVVAKVSSDSSSVDPGAALELARRVAGASL